VEAGVHAPTQTIKRPWNSVVLDSLRELDEKSEKITSITKKVFSILSGQKGVQNIYLLDYDGKIIEGKANEKTNPKTIVFVWYKLKKMLSLFYADSFHYTFLRDRWGYVFIIEFQGSLIVIETDLNTVVEDFVSLIYKLLKGVR
jgi:hypothetical protein